MARVITRGTPPARQWWIGVEVTCRHCNPATVYAIEAGDAVSHPPTERAAIDAAVTACPVCGLKNLITRDGRTVPSRRGADNGSG